MYLRALGCLFIFPPPGVGLKGLGRERQKSSIPLSKGRGIEQNKKRARPHRRKGRREMYHPTRGGVRGGRDRKLSCPSLSV